MKFQVNCCIKKLRKSTFVNPCSIFLSIEEQGTLINDFRSELGAQIKKLPKSTFVNPCSIFLSIEEQETPINDFRSELGAEIKKKSEIDVR